MEDVADRFQVSSTTLSRLFNTWILFLARELPLLFPWPSQQMIQQHVGPDFATSPNTRIIIDCTEIFAVLKSMEAIVLFMCATSSPTVPKNLQ